MSTPRWNLPQTLHEADRSMDLQAMLMDLHPGMKRTGQIDTWLQMHEGVMAHGDAVDANLRRHAQELGVDLSAPRSPGALPHPGRFLASVAQALMDARAAEQST